LQFPLEITKVGGFRVPLTERGSEFGYLPGKEVGNSIIGVISAPDLWVAEFQI
jgi:hypothetical protein